MTAAHKQMGGPKMKIVEDCVAKTGVQKSVFCENLACFGLLDVCFVPKKWVENRPVHRGRALVLPSGRVTIVSLSRTAAVYSATPTPSFWGSWGSPGAQIYSFWVVVELIVEGILDAGVFFEFSCISWLIWSVFWALMWFQTKQKHPELCRMLSHSVAFCLSRILNHFHRFRTESGVPKSVISENWGSWMCVLLGLPGLPRSSNLLFVELFLS